MALPKLIDEVNRLFDELVRDPWRVRLPTAPTPTAATASGRQIEFEVPVPHESRGDVTVSLEGRRVTVTVRQRTIRRSPAGDKVESRRQRTTRHSFELPPHTEVTSVSMGFENDVMRLRLTVHTHRA